MVIRSACLSFLELPNPFEPPSLARSLDIMRHPATRCIKQAGLFASVFPQAQVKWARSGAVARIVALTRANSCEELVYHEGGQGRHLWLNPNLAACVAS